MIKASNELLNILEGVCFFSLVLDGVEGHGHRAQRRTGDQTERTSSMEMKRRRRQPRQTLLATIVNGVVVDSVEAKEPAS